MSSPVAFHSKGIASAPCPQGQRTCLAMTHASWFVHGGRLRRPQVFPLSSNRHCEPRAGYGRMREAIPCNNVRNDETQKWRDVNGKNINPRGLVCEAYEHCRPMLVRTSKSCSSPTINRQRRESPERVHNAEDSRVSAAPYLG